MITKTYIFGEVEIDTWHNGRDRLHIGFTQGLTGVEVYLDVSMAEKLKTSLEQTIQDFHKVKEDSCKKKE